MVPKKSHMFAITASNIVTEFISMLYHSLNLRLFTFKYVRSWLPEATGVPPGHNHSCAIKIISLMSFTQQHFLNYMILITLPVHLYLDHALPTLIKFCILVNILQSFCTTMAARSNLAA